MKRIFIARIIVASMSMLVASLVSADGRGDDVPKVFEPGTISSPLDDSAPAFTPDGNSVLFGRGTPGAYAILESHRVGNGWSAPEIAPFSGQYNDMEPTMAPDGSYLIFVSSRPKAEGGKPLDGDYGGRVHPGFGANLWRVDRKGAGWGPAVRLPDIVNRTTSTYAPSVAANGTLYFMEPSGPKSKFHLYRAEKRGGVYQQPEQVLFGGDDTSDVDPAVAPDESFVVFGSGRPPAKDMDLFIVFRRDNRFCAPIHLGNSVNAVGSDAEARLGPDHRTLYFSSVRVVPATQPRTASSTAGEFRRAESWNNGLFNIWSLSLAPWLDHPRCDDH